MSGLFSCFGGNRVFNYFNKKKHGKRRRGKKNKRKRQTLEEKAEERPESPPTVEEKEEERTESPPTVEVPEESRIDELQSENGEVPENVATVDYRTKFAERYIADLYKGEWNAAYEKLTTVCQRTEKKSQQILANFCTEAYLYCRRTAWHQMDMLWTALLNPSASHLKAGTPRQTTASKPQSMDSIPDTLRAAVMDFRKRSPSKEFVDDLYDDFLSHTNFKKCRHLGSFQGHDLCGMAPYVKKCLEVSWEMIVQDPPMYLNFKVRQDSDVDTSNFECYGHSGKKVDYLVWPALFTEENGSLLQKGVVQAVAESQE